MKASKKRDPIDPKTLALLYPHADNCGFCEGGRLMEEYLMPYMDGTPEEIEAASERRKQKWEETKYFKFAQECIAKGLDWQEEFAKRGWEP